MSVSRRDIARAVRRMETDPIGACGILFELAVEEYGDDVAVRLVWWMRTVGLGGSA